MPARKQAKVSVTCPKCGHQQLEPREAYSTVCKHCHQHIRLEEVRQPVPKPPQPSATPDLKAVVCFDCGTELEVPVSAESTMCKRCGRHVDLRDYEINQAVSKNFRTHGCLIIETKGNVFNTEATVGDAVIKGKFLGKLFARRTLTIYSGAQIKGTIQTGCLIIPEGNQFKWPELSVERAEIRGELVSSFKRCGTIVLTSTAVFFGNVEAVNLLVEPGAIWVGDAQIRPADDPSVRKPDKGRTQSAGRSGRPTQQQMLP